MDSCLEPETGEPISLHYLRSLGLDPSAVVRLVVATHWDDDHIRGISQVVDECPNADVALSSALTRDDFVQLVLAEEQHATGIGTGVDELRSVLRRSNGRRIWAKNNTPLYPRPLADGPSIGALSPSEDSMERGIMALAEIALERPRAVGGRFQAPDKPNGASVAVFGLAGQNAILLGADLECSPNPESGWTAVLDHSGPSRPASFVKVPHHGSDGAHDGRMWEELVEEHAIAVVTPFSNGRVERPTPEDIARICAEAVRLYATALPGLRRARLDREVERLVQRTRGGDVLEVHGWGHVRARRPIEGGEWIVECAGDARLLC